MINLYPSLGDLSRYAILQSVQHSLYERSIFMNPTNPLHVSEHNVSPLRRFSRGDGMDQRRPVASLMLAPIFVLVICFAFSLPATAQAHAPGSSPHLTRGQHSHQASFAEEICYQAHVQNIGWQSPVCDGQVAGTIGQSLRMEAISIWLVNPAYGQHVCYQAHVQNIGWQSPVCDGQVAGTVGQSLRMEAIIIFPINAPCQYTVQYIANVQNIGWQYPWRSDGQVAGTTGQSLRMEAIAITLCSY